MKKTAKGLGLEKMREICKRNTNFHWESFLWKKNSTTFSAIPFISEMFLFLVFMLRHKILKSKFKRPAKLLISLGVR